MALYQLTSLLLIAGLVSTSRGDETESANHHIINVLPGGEIHLSSRNLGPFECAFTYAAQGGTNEVSWLVDKLKMKVTKYEVSASIVKDWFFDLDADHDGKLYTCSIGRPSGLSYLMFSQFNIEIHGAELKDVEIYSSAGEKLSPTEYNIDKEKNTVSSVEGEFQQQLARIHVLAKGIKTEL